MTLTNNLFRNNIAVNSELPQYSSHATGGGLLLDAYGSLQITVENNRFLSNTALISPVQSLAWAGGAAFFLNDDSTATIADNEFRLNHASANGGESGGGASGILLSASSAGATFSGNLVSENSTGATEFAQCAAALFDGGPIVVRDNLFRDNQSEAADTLGTVCTGGAVRMENVAIVNNTILSGTPGLIVRLNSYSMEPGSDARLAHLTVANNQGGDGVGLLVANFSDPIDPDTVHNLWVTNTLFAGHAVGISATGGTTTTLNGVLWHNVPVTASVSLTATFNVSNQVVGDPVLAPDGYHLLGGSAAIDRGVPAGVTQDIDGDSRQGLPDLGADEWQGIRIYCPVALQP